MTFRDELIEAGARQLWTWYSTDERGSWEDARFPESWRDRARSLLATWEAHRTTDADTPRLAVVEQYGKAWDHNRFTNELIGMDDDGVNRLYRLAPDLPDTRP